MININGYLSTRFGGRGLDKKFPYLLRLYKKAFSFTHRDIPVRVNTAYGDKLFVSQKDSGLGLMLSAGREYEPILTEIFQKSLRKGDTVVDIGANIGYFTKLAARTVGRKGKVIAVEPSRKNLRYLKMNTKGLPNVLVIPFALSSKLDKQFFAEDPANPGESGFRKSGTSYVKTIRFDDLAKQTDLSKTRLVKIDVEGAEVWVLEGARKTLRKSKNITLVCECNPKSLKELGFQTDDLIREINACGLKLAHIIDERLGRKEKYSEEVLTKMLNESAYVSLVAEKRYEKQ